MKSDLVVSQSIGKAKDFFPFHVKRDKQAEFADVTAALAVANQAKGLSGFALLDVER